MNDLENTNLNTANVLPEGIVAGRNAVIELLKSGRAVDKIFIKQGEHEGSLKLIAAGASAHGIPFVEVSKQTLDKMAYGVVHQGVVALAALKDYVSVDDILRIADERGEPPFVAILDGIEDPQNLGAIIRSAECAGVHGVIIPKRRSALLTSTVFKASAGALEHMAVARVANLSYAIDELKKAGVWVYAAEAGGESYEKVDMTGPVGIVFGSEGNGVSKLLKSRCDMTLSIPLHGKINSLNVAAAAAVLLFKVASVRSN